MAHLLWDMDGTLIDSTLVVPRAFTAAVAELGGPAVDTTAVVAAYSLGVPEVMLAHLLGRPLVEGEAEAYYRRLHGAAVARGTARRSQRLPAGPGVEACGAQPSHSSGGRGRPKPVSPPAAGVVYGLHHGGVHRGQACALAARPLAGHLRSLAVGGLQLAPRLIGEAAVSVETTSRLMLPSTMDDRAVEGPVDEPSPSASITELPLPTAVRGLVIVAAAAATITSRDATWRGSAG